MKNQSRFDAFTKMAVMALASIGAGMREMAERPRGSVYRSRRTATAKPANRPAGHKLLAKAWAGTLGLGIHGNGKSVGGKTTFSPKKDTGKGPARTVPHGKRQAASHFRRMQVRDAHLG